MDKRSLERRWKLERFRKKIFLPRVSSKSSRDLRVDPNMCSSTCFCRHSSDLYFITLFPRFRAFIRSLSYENKIETCKSNIRPIFPLPIRIITIVRRRRERRVRSARKENLKPRETGLAIGQVQTGFGVYRSVISESHRFQESTRGYRKTVVLRNRWTFGSPRLGLFQANLVSRFIFR